MRRICVLSDYCNPDSSARLKVAPPVFASPTDAWNHFIKHPEDYPLSDYENYDDTLDRQSDVFDRMDYFFNFQQGVPAERPLAVAAGAEEAALEERSDETAASEDAGE